MSMSGEGWPSIYLKNLMLNAVVGIDENDVVFRWVVGIGGDCVKTYIFFIIIYVDY